MQFSLTMQDDCSGHHSTKIRMAQKSLKTKSPCLYESIKSPDFSLTLNRDLEFLDLIHNSLMGNKIYIFPNFSLTMAAMPEILTKKTLRSSMVAFSGRGLNFTVLYQEFNKNMLSLRHSSFFLAHIRP